MPSSSANSFTDYIQENEAEGLHVYMTNEHYLRRAYSERNNQALFEACRDGADKICEVLIYFKAGVNCKVEQSTPLFITCDKAQSA